MFQSLRNASSDLAAQAVLRAPVSPCPPGRACCAQLPLRARDRSSEAAALWVPDRVLELRPEQQGGSAAVSRAELSECAVLLPAAAPEGNADDCQVAIAPTVTASMTSRASLR